jgi:hypothetical protein
VINNASWPMFDPQAQTLLLNTLRLLTSSVSTLTVLLLVREGQAAAAPVPAESNVDTVEQVLRSNLRWSDAVFRCGPECWAALLIGADAGGACAVARRLHRTLAEHAGAALPFSLGWASTDGPKREAEALMALALEGRRTFLPVADERLFASGEAGKVSASAEGCLGQVFDAQVLTGAMRRDRARRRLSRMSDVAPPERPVMTQARVRARELGVPYLAPPQHIPSSVRKLLPLEVMRQYRCLPVGRNRHALTVALADPTDAGALLHLEQMTGLTIFPVMTDPEALEHLARLPVSRRAAQELPQQ